MPFHFAYVYDDLQNRCEHCFGFLDQVRLYCSLSLVHFKRWNYIVVMPLSS
jgi:hypothetical protein